MSEHGVLQLSDVEMADMAARIGKVYDSLTD